MPSEMLLSALIKETVKAFFIMILITLLLVPTMTIVDALLGQRSYGVLDPHVYTPDHPFIMAFFLSLSCTVSALAEELFFRGFLYNALKSRLSVVTAAGIQALVFAFAHPYSISGKLLLFFMGIALVIVYEKSKNLLTPILVHGFWNALGAVAFHLFRTIM